MSDTWKKTLIRMENSVGDAIKVIDESSLRTALVVDEHFKLLGIVTDGDIRRGLLRGVNLDSNICEVVNRTPKVSTMESSKKERLAILKEHDLLSLPIVNDLNEVVGLDLLPSLTEKNVKNNIVFLMAGGFGQRLRPLTEDCPKPLLNVGSKPILESILDRFSSFGFHNFYLSLHYLPEKIKSHFGNGENWDVSIKYVHEETPLGTAGALSLLPETIPDEPIIVMNGDLLTKVNFENLLEFHKSSMNQITMAVREYSFQVPYGVVKHTAGRIESLEEKPKHQFFVNAGIYVIEPNVIKSMARNKKVDMTELLDQQLSEKKNLSMFPIHEYWLDIGQMNDFKTAQREFERHFTEDPNDG